MKIEKVKQKFPNHIVEEFRGYMIIAQDKRDFESKQNSICRGNTYGFYKTDTK
jgi:hypothetical protein